MHDYNKWKPGGFLLLAILIMSCGDLFEDHASQFHLDNINQVEWAPPDRSSSSLAYTANFDADEEVSETISLVVQLIGAQAERDRSVFVEVNTDDSDAEDGQYLEILNANNEVVIPANSNHGEVEVEILAENVGNGRELYTLLELLEGDELRVAANMKEMDLTIEKDPVSFSAEFEGGQETDPAGRSNLTGLSLPDVLIADIAVVNLNPETAYDWQVHQNTCNDGEDVVGDSGAYPPIETDEEGGGSSEAELEERIYQAQQYHLRIQDNLGLEVTCVDYNGS